MANPARVEVSESSTRVDTKKARGTIAKEKSWKGRKEVRERERETK